MADYNFDDVMDIIKSGAAKVSKEAGKFTKTAASAVGNKTQEMKLRYSLSELEERLNAQFAAIGSSVYTSFKTGTEQEDFSELFGRIDALNDEIEVMRNKLSDVTNTVRCESCDNYVSSSHTFCPECGAKMKNEEAN